LSAIRASWVIGRKTEDRGNAVIPMVHSLRAAS